MTEPKKQTSEKRHGGQHGHSKYFTKQGKKRAYTAIKTKYMVSKVWRFPDCDNYNYTLAGKTHHLQTKKHKKNAAKTN